MQNVETLIHRRSSLNALLSRTLITGPQDFCDNGSQTKDQHINDTALCRIRIRIEMREVIRAAGIKFLPLYMALLED